MAASAISVHSASSLISLPQGIESFFQSSGSTQFCPCIAQSGRHSPEHRIQKAVSKRSPGLVQDLQQARSWTSKLVPAVHYSGGVKRVGRLAPCCAGVEALVFDCDGVILESEDLHRQAYNEGFKHFDVRCPDKADSVVEWTPEFYEMLQNKIGGGKPKMRWYFKEHGWPTSTVLPEAPKNEEEQSKLIDTLQDWKSAKYRDYIGSGTVKPRPGIVEVMDAARAKGLKIAVCSASTKESCIYTLTHLIGKDRYESLDCFLAGDDVNKKKPDPTIYLEAVKRLGVPPEKCLVIEDSAIGLEAAQGGGMACVITTTASTASQKFEGAAAVYGDMDGVSIDELLELAGKRQATRTWK